MTHQPASHDNSVYIFLFVVFNIMDSPDSICILELLPGEDGSPIKCTTRVAALSKAGPYEAVSYVWGKGPQSRSVLVDGEDVDVTETLHATLRRFRNPAASRSIWVDQLCIDQSNSKEETRQVNMMGTSPRTARSL
jgi:hypothetical protein